MFCQECGNEMNDNAVICPQCGAAAQPQPSSVKSRVIYILLALFLGCLGIHNFYAGYNGRGIAQLLITLLLGWLVFPYVAVVIWNIIEICIVTADSEGKRFS